MTDVDEERVRQREALLRSEAPIDVRALTDLYSLDELCATAEDYYSSGDWSGWLAKPFVSLQETPELLICLGYLLHGIKPVGGMDILDFGAGPGWVSHALTSLGARMIVCDVSATALQVAAARFDRWPISVPHAPPRFIQFDGRTFDLPDGSVDAIVSFDAFHHVPNAADVIHEMSRILRDGGVAAFVEPGPKHSWSAGSQYEMRHHAVVENDVVIEDIWRVAQEAGFGDIQLSIFGVTPFHVSLPAFDDFLAGGTTGDQVLASTRHYMATSRRLFFLRKANARPKDSRFGEGLLARIEPASEVLASRAGEPVTVRLTVTNAGTVVWLPSSSGVGSVWVGVHLHEGGEASSRVLHTQPLPIEDTDGLLPGATVDIDVHLPGLRAGAHRLEFDLVAQQITWFQTAGSPTVSVDVVVN